MCMCTVYRPPGMSTSAGPRDDSNTARSSENDFSFVTLLRLYLPDITHTHNGGPGRVVKRLLRSRVAAGKWDEMRWDDMRWWPTSSPATDNGLTPSTRGTETVYGRSNRWFRRYSQKEHDNDMEGQSRYALRTTKSYIKHRRKRIDNINTSLFKHINITHKPKNRTNYVDEACCTYQEAENRTEQTKLRMLLQTA